MEEKKGSILPWLFGLLIGASFAYLYLKNKNPTPPLSPSYYGFKTSQPTINLDVSGLELDQLQTQRNIQSGTYLTMTPEPLIKVTEEDNSTKGFESISRGNLKKEKYQDYYDVSATVTNATANDPNDYNSNVYDVHNIYNILGRKAPFLYVMNDSTAQANVMLYVVLSHDGGVSGSRESMVYPGETVEYHEIYELKVRSPTMGTAYRVSEYKHFVHN